MLSLRLQNHEKNESDANVKQWLSFSRPIVFLDIETTGLDIEKDEIIEIGAIKILPDDGKEIVFNERFKVSTQIAESSKNIHHITSEMLKDCFTFAERAYIVYTFLADCDFAGFNIKRFDLPMLVNAFAREGLEFKIQNRNVIDCKQIFHEMEKRDLRSALKFYCSQDFEANTQHTAVADAAAAKDVLRGQLAMYKNREFCIDTQNNSQTIVPEADILSKIFSLNAVDVYGNIVRDFNGAACFNFGKYRNKTVEYVLQHDKNYIFWFVYRSSFPSETRKILESIACDLNYCLLKTYCLKCNNNE